MKKKFIAKLNSYTVLQGVIESERANLSVIDFFDERETIFNQAVEDIMNYAPQLEYANEAEMERYNKEYGVLLKGISALSTKLVSYAGKVKDQSLREDVEYSIAELNRMKKTQVMMVANVMVERGNKVLQTGEVPQLTADLIDAVANPLALVLKWKDALRHQQLKSRADSRFLEKAFAAADEALSDLFLSIDELMHTKPDLHKRLADAATAIETLRRLSVKGSVAEAKTEYPIKRVKLIIRRLGEEVSTDLMVSTPDLVKLSAAKGGFYIQSLPEGTYLLTASKLGYSTTNVEFNVVAAETTFVNVLLSKS